MRLSKNIQNLLWDVDVKTLNEKRHADFLIARVAEKGGTPEIIWLKRKFGLDKIRKVVRHSRNVSAQTKNFWSII